MPRTKRRKKYTKRRKARRNPTRKYKRRKRRASRRNPYVKSHKVKRHYRRKRRKNPYGRKRRYTRRRRNPMGRRGKFNILPSRKDLSAAAYKGGGAVASEMVRATAYTLIGRVSGSVAEDVLGRLFSGAVTGMLAGYFMGSRAAAAVVEGTYTVTLYKLVADAVALATRGNPKLLGVIANPFTAVPSKPLIPGFGMAAGPAPVGAGRLGAVVSEPDVLPLGGIIPETDIVPIGDMAVPGKFRKRF